MKDYTRIVESLTELHRIEYLTDEQYIHLMQRANKDFVESELQLMKRRQKGRNA